MTVSTADNREQYDGNDSATEFDYTFKIFKADDLTVILTASDDTETTLVRGSDYSVDGVGDEGGGTVTYPLSGDPLATGETLTILREIPVVQETDLRNQGAYYPETIEDELDRSRMIDQQQQEQLGRTLSRTRASDYFDARGRRIADVGNAVEDQDAYTKGQADARFANDVITKTGTHWDAELQQIRNLQTRQPPSSTDAMNFGATSLHVSSVLNNAETPVDGWQRVRWVNTLADLQALPTSELVDGQGLKITTTGRAGDFVVRVGDFSTEVTNDPESGVWVAFDDDPTGGSIVAMRSGVTWVDLEWFGATFDGVTRSVEAQAALDFVESLGGGLVQLPAGTLTASGLQLKPKTLLKGVNRELTTIKAPDGWASGNVIETENFDANLLSGGSGTTESGVCDLTIDGNFENWAGVASDTEGFCYRHYGLRPFIDQVRIVAAPGIGLHTAGSGTTRESVDWFREDTKLGKICGLRIFGCLNDGWVFDGPSDLYVDDIELGVNGWPDTDAYSTSRKSLLVPSRQVANVQFRKTVEIGFLHSFGNVQGRGVIFGNGSTLTRIKFNEVISESCNSGGLIMGLTRVQGDKLDVHNNYGATSGDAEWLDESTLETTISSFEGIRSANSSGQDLLVLSGDSANYKVQINGGNNAGVGVRDSGFNNRVEGQVASINTDQAYLVDATASAPSANLVVRASGIGAEVVAGAANFNRMQITSAFGNTTPFAGFSGLPTKDQKQIDLYDIGAGWEANKGSWESSEISAADTAVNFIDIPVDLLYAPAPERIQVSTVYVSGAVPPLDSFQIAEANTTKSIIRVFYKFAATGSGVIKFSVSVM